MFQSNSHRRKNLLNGEWVLVSPQRTQRPWQGQIADIEPCLESKYEPDCYLCPGNRRAGEQFNPDYTGPYAFDNDFPALVATSTDCGDDSNDLFIAQPETGCYRVVCFSQRHDLHLVSMEPAAAVEAVRFLFDEFCELDQRKDIAYVQLFENRGQMMGCSNQHPHAQIWATSNLPVEPAKELETQIAWFKAKGRTLLHDYLQAELKSGQRLVTANTHAASIVPFWATWPYETLIVPTAPAAGPTDLDQRQLSGFTRILQDTLRASDRLFGTPMPYSMGFHPRPSDGKDHPEWQFHAHIFPPLLRSASIRKHMVGFEMLAMPQRDLTPEIAANQLRKLITVDP